MRDSLGGDSLVVDAAVDERGQLVGRLPDVGSILGHSELLEELVQDLDALLILGRHLGGCLDFSFSKGMGIKKEEKVGSSLKPTDIDGGVDSGGGLRGSFGGGSPKNKRASVEEKVRLEEDDRGEERWMEEDEIEKKRGRGGKT